MSIINRLLKNNLSQVLQFGSKWLLSVSLIIFLDKGQFANFSFLYSISNLLIGVVPFGSSIYLINNFSREKLSYTYSDGKENIVELEKSLAFSVLLLLIIILLILFVYIILNIFNFTLNSLIYISLGFLLSIPYVINLIALSFLKSINNFNTELIIYFWNFIGVIIYILFLYYGYGNERYNILLSISLFNPVVFLLISNIAISIYLLLKTKISLKRLCILFLTKKTMYSVFLDRKFYGGLEILNTLINQISLVILFYLLTLEEYSVYRIFLVLVSPFLIFSTSIGQVILLYLRKNLNSQKIIRKIFIKTQVLNIFIFIFSFIMIILFSEIAFDYFKVNVSYLKLFYIFAILILLRLLISGNEMLLVAQNKQNIRFYIMVYVMILNVLGLLTITPFFGLYSTIFISLFTNLIILISTSKIIYKYSLI